MSNSNNSIKETSPELIKNTFRFCRHCSVQCNELHDTTHLSRYLITIYNTESIYPADSACHRTWVGCKWVGLRHQRMIRVTHTQTSRVLGWARKLCINLAKCLNYNCRPRGHFVAMRTSGWGCWMESKKFLLHIWSINVFNCSAHWMCCCTFGIIPFNDK